MENNKKAVDFVRAHENLRRETYRCTGNKLTIGYGHTGRDVLEGMTITREQAEELLREDMREAVDAVDALIDAPLNENQRAALISFAFNVGYGQFRDSTLRRVINADPNDRPRIEAQWRRWNKSQGKVTEGLINRREDELNLYFTKE